jgi:cardiolipin synthase
VSKINTVLQILLIAATLFLVGFDLKAPILITTLIWTVAVSTLVSGAAYVWVAAHGR